MSRSKTGMEVGDDWASARSTGNFVYSGTELEAMAHAPNYYGAIHRCISEHLGPHTVEVGAGVGTFSTLLASDPRVKKLTLYEPAGNNYQLLASRFAGNQSIRTINGYFEAQPEDLADAIILVNVLEHVPDDVSFLDTASRGLKAGGRLLIFVPAMPVLFGSLDREFEHYRRYTKGQLRDRLLRAGFQIVQLRYMNLPGVIPWFLAGRVLRKTTLSPRDVRMYDRWVAPWVFKMERRFDPPFGQSLLAIATVEEKQ